MATEPGNKAPAPQGLSRPCGPLPRGLHGHCRSRQPTPSCPATIRQGFVRRMVDNLMEIDPALLLGEEPAGTMFGRSGEHVDSMIRYARIRRYMPVFLDALALIATRPIERLDDTRRMVSVRNVRRVDSRTLRTLLRSPDFEAVFEGGATDVVIDPRFDVAHVVRSCDSAANRALRSLVDDVLRAVRELMLKLRVDAERHEFSQARSDPSTRLPRRIELLAGFESRLLRAVHKDPIASVTRRETTAAGLNAVSADPAYARAYRFGRAALRRGIAGERDDLLLALGPTWEIYERCCFADLCRRIQASQPGLSWRRTANRDRVDRVTVTGDLGNGASIMIHLQRRFSASGGFASDGFSSISAERRPDIVIEKVSAGGNRRFLVLDAKYRTKRTAVLDSMTSAHVYRDALRHGLIRPEFALLLCPQGGGAPWLENFDFISRECVGVLVHSPDDSSSVDTFLQRWIRSDSSSV